uniref:Putative TATA-box bind protein n=1 Tax=Chionoecetes opilio bacilliform virus TaxID=1825681 RepID=A0A1Q3DLM8_9VIRU|nr:putative TATA-box bind protein [Chionoecetes opilio bacilliform virus]
MVHLGPSSEPPASMFNSGAAAEDRSEWCFEKEYKQDKDMLVNLCYEEIAETCHQYHFNIPPFLRHYEPTENNIRLNKLMLRIWQGSNGAIQTGRGNFTNKHIRIHKAEQEREKHAVTLARLSTLMATYRFICREIMSGMVPKLAKMFGTDVYSILHLVKKIPLSPGHAASLGNERSAYKTPGDAYFSNIFVLDDNSRNDWPGPEPSSRQGTQSTSSTFMARCEACGEQLNCSATDNIRLCNNCEEHSTQYIKSALINIRGEKRKRRYENSDKQQQYINEDMDNIKKLKRCTPSDFIDSKSIVRFNDEETGTPRVGLQVNVKDILNTLLTNRGMEDRPTANYRTSLHTDTQNKSNLSKLLMTALKERGMTDEDAHNLKTFLESSKGVSLLAELRRTRSGVASVVKLFGEDEAVSQKDTT